MESGALRLVWRALGLAALAALLAVAAVLLDHRAAFGGQERGAELERLQHSPEHRGHRFENPQPLINSIGGTLATMLHPSAEVTPRSPVPFEPVDRHRFDSPPASGLRVTWLGHSTSLIEIDGARVLVDPMWSERASPIPWLGPKRWYPPPLPFAELPAIDAVLISHDHYDHLDMDTLRAMKDWNTTFVVPLGVGAHLARWGVPRSHIVEMDWWETARVGPLQIHCVPARHASGRSLLDQDSTLWAGYALIGPAHRAYYSGDSGLFPALRTIGDRLGPFDVTMIEVGQYAAAWPDWHMGPEQAVRAHQWVRGRLFIPVHWGLFALAAHGWTEPAERAIAAAAQSGVAIAVPRPGESIEPEHPPALRRWWPALPWTSGAADPIVSDQLDDGAPAPR